MHVRYVWGTSRWQGHAASDIGLSIMTCLLKHLVKLQQRSVSETSIGHVQHSQLPASCKDHKTSRSKTCLICASARLLYVHDWVAWVTCKAISLTC